MVDSIEAAARAMCTMLIERQHTEREEAKSPVQSRAADCQPASVRHTVSRLADANTKNLIGAAPYLTAASQEAAAGLPREQRSLTRSNSCWQTCRQDETWLLASVCQVRMPHTPTIVHP